MLHATVEKDWKISLQAVTSAISHRALITPLITRNIILWHPTHLYVFLLIYTIFLARLSASICVTGGGGAQLYEAAIKLREALRGRAALLVVDRTDIVDAAEADGVLLSPQGMSPLRE